MVINVHAGHNPDGKIAYGAVGLIKESTEARKVKTEVISLLKSAGHTVYDCTVDNGTSQSNVLKKIVSKCNAHKVDLDVSIHFNAGANDRRGNGSTTGTEVLVYDNKGIANITANKICNAISKLGYKNRGVKIRRDLYVLNSTKAPALLIECCFVDDKDDVNKYNYKTMANSIVKGIIGTTVSSSNTTNTTKTNSFRVKIIVSELNVRAGAGVSYKINRTVKKNEVFTIIETKGNWGKLKSGAGWINISNSYCKRV